MRGEKRRNQDKSSYCLSGFDFLHDSYIISKLLFKTKDKKAAKILDINRSHSRLKFIILLGVRDTLIVKYSPLTCL